MGPKISEAKTPPLRKPASLVPLFSCTLTPLFSLPHSKHLFVPYTQKNHCFAHKCLLRGNMHLCAIPLKCLFKI